MILLNAYMSLDVSLVHYSTWVQMNTGKFGEMKLFIAITLIVNTMFVKFEYALPKQEYLGDYFINYFDF